MELTIDSLAKKWNQKADGSESLIVDNPASEEPLASLTLLSPLATQARIDSVVSFFPHFKTISPTSRGDALKRAGLLFRENAESLARIITLENGKVLKEALLEVHYAADFLDWYAEEGKRVYGETVPSGENGTSIKVEREPIGPVGIITPWNFPLAMITRKVAPALAAGCSCVLKPAPETPFSALAAQAIIIASGIQKEAFEVVISEADMTSTLFFNSPLRKISFTGSTAVGKLLVQKSAQHLQKLTLELGGNAPSIIFDDVDFDAIFDTLAFGRFRNAGQACTSMNRFFVHASRKAECIQRFADHLSKMNVGDGMNPTSHIGPLINQKAASKVERLVANSLQAGAALHSKPLSIRQRFVTPVLLSEVTPSMEIFSTEIFGPVVSIISFDDEDEVIRLANQTAYGLAAYVFSKDLNRARRVGASLQFGMVGINSNKLQYAQAPFGGIKESGMGREGGKEGLAEFFNLKMLVEKDLGK